jgi:hypothetical protein
MGNQMTDERQTQSDQPNDGGLTTISIPPDKAQEVLEFIATLNSEEDDVAGLMLGGIGSIASRPMAANQKHATGTGCLSSPTGWKCSDVDRTPGDE